MSGYKKEEGINSSEAAVRNPVRPPQKIIYPSGDFRSPIAWFIPWIGNGE
jgi:hypothetical protein